IHGCDVSALNGRFPVDSVLAPDATSQLILGFRIMFASDPGTATTGFAFKSPAQTLPLKKLVQDSGTIAKATTATPHKRAEGDWVCISGVANDEAYNGTFQITAIDETSGLWFKYDLGAAPDEAAAAGVMWGSAGQSKGKRCELYPEER